MPKPNTPKLNDTQLVILSTASQREDGLASAPEGMKAAAAKAAITKLLGLRYLKEVRVKRDQPAWRTDEDEKPIGLKITKAGSAAIGVEDDGAVEEWPAPAETTKRKTSQGKSQAQVEITGSASAKGPREGTKKALVLSLLSRPEGATIDDLLSATKWLPHTTRAALTGLRKEGYEFVKGKNEDGETVYRTGKAPRASSKAAD
jgi:Protein of unknown function (DUF3489)